MKLQHKILSFHIAYKLCYTYSDQSVDSEDVRPTRDLIGLKSISYLRLPLTLC